MVLMIRTKMIMVVVLLYDDDDGDDDDDNDGDYYPTYGGSVCKPLTLSRPNHNCDI